MPTKASSNLLTSLARTVGSAMGAVASKVDGVVGGKREPADPVQPQEKKAKLKRRAPKTSKPKKKAKFPKTASRKPASRKRKS